MTHVVELIADPGLTLLASLFPVNSDVVAADAASVTEQANVKGMYLASFASPPSGAHLIVAYDVASSPPLAVAAAYTYLEDASGIYRSGNYADVVSAAQVELMRAIAINKTITDPATGAMTVLAEDDTTPLLTAHLYENVAETQDYRGLGAEVRTRLEPVTIVPAVTPAELENSKHVNLPSGAFFDVNIDLSGDTALEVVYVFWWNEGNAVTESLDFSGCTSLELVRLEGMNVLVSVNLSGCSALVSAELGNYLVTDVDITGCASLLRLRVGDSVLTEASVDGALSTLDAAGLSGGNCYLVGASNSAPSAAGLVSKANLEARGWVVEVSP